MTFKTLLGCAVAIVLVGGAVGGISFLIHQDVKQQHFYEVLIADHTIRGLNGFEPTTQAWDTVGTGRCVRYNGTLPIEGSPKRQAATAFVCMDVLSVTSHGVSVSPRQ